MRKSNLPQNLRQIVQTRAKGYCEYCLCQDDFATGSFNIEHIIPIKLGGTNDLQNLAYSCNGCNNHKFTKIKGIDPNSDLIVELFHPRLHTWFEHFCWDSTMTLILGKSAIGRATIVALKMNRKQVKNLRGAMVILGIHPPKIV